MDWWAWLLLGYLASLAAFVAVWSRAGRVLRSHRPMPDLDDRADSGYDPATSRPLEEP